MRLFQVGKKCERLKANNNLFFVFFSFFFFFFWRIEIRSGWLKNHPVPEPTLHLICTFSNVTCPPLINNWKTGQNTWGKKNKSVFSYWKIGSARLWLLKQRKKVSWLLPLPQFSDWSWQIIFGERKNRS